MAHHRFLRVTLTVKVLDPAPAPGAADVAAVEHDDEEIKDDLKKAVKGLKPRNKAGKRYSIVDVEETG